MRLPNSENLRFRMNWEKTIEAIDFIAQMKPGITQYYICKILFFADREHLLDYGRPITGDRYLAMQHGPVPTAVLDILKSDSGYPDELISLLSSRVDIADNGSMRRVTSHGENNFTELSGSDMEYIRDAFNKYHAMCFAELKKISHEDVAYEEAWAKHGNNNEMNIELWFEEFENPKLVVSQLKDHMRCSA